MDFKTHTLFPTLIYSFKSPKSPNTLVDFLYQVKKEEPKGRIVSNEGGWQSFDLLKFPIFQDLIKYLESSIYHICKKNLKLNSLWGNISSTHHFNLLHHHSYLPQSISGVYYLQTPPNCGEIIFHNSNNLNESFVFTPQNNDIIIFSGTSLHRVSPNKSDQDRISLAFNVEV